MPINDDFDAFYRKQLATPPPPAPPSAGRGRTAPVEDDADRLLKKYGAPAAAPAPTAASASSPRDEDLDWQQRAGKGVAKSLAETATAIPQLANAGIRYFSPSTASQLDEMAEQIPGVKRMEKFAAEPSTSWAETGGRIGGELAQVLPGAGAAKLAPWLAKVAPQAMVKPVFAAGRGFTAAPRTLPTAAANTAEAAARGAAGGAITDPQHPARGAAIGAGTAGLAGVAGQALRSQVGQWLSDHLARYGPSVAIHEAARLFGVPVDWVYAIGIPHLLRWHSSPYARALGGAGRATADVTGQVLQAVPPVMAGAGAGEGARRLEGRR